VDIVGVSKKSRKGVQEGINGGCGCGRRRGDGILQAIVDLANPVIIAGAKGVGCIAPQRWYDIRMVIMESLHM